MCDIRLCVNTCVESGGAWVYLALNVDCTGIFIVYMYAHCIIFVCVYFYIMLSFTIHSRFTLCDLLFILLALGIS